MHSLNKKLSYVCEAKLSHVGVGTSEHTFLDVATVCVPY